MDRTALCASGDCAADMGQCRGSASSRQNKFGQPRQFGIPGLNGFIEACDAGLTQQLKTRNRELTADIKEIVLDVNQYLADLGGQVLGQQHADGAIELINIADCVDACVVFGNTASIT